MDQITEVDLIVKTNLKFALYLHCISKK